MQSNKASILSTIDELNQYLNGNVTKFGVKLALVGLLNELEVQRDSE